ncbi:MAG TPA: hypothetical protein DHW82_10600 [Spirochaetia bacterium]|nr:MAG: hypothetical protein A2Y41_01225 [Spirochaetes bacterium GWB1_36_13]HCL57442.1 hypothetical protein [Spirochaetia bacterium]
MFLKNLAEDHVIKVVQDVLSDLPDVCKCSICIEDITTYVLNRVSPYYISSGRGILHMEKDIEPFIQDQADIYTLVLQAIDIINKRRKSNVHTKNDDGLLLLSRKENEIVSDFYLNFPYIVGRILDSSYLKPKGDLKVQLMIFQNDKYVLCPMKEPNWTNPYQVPDQFSGYFTFWPNAKKAEDQKNIGKETVYFKLEINGVEYEEEFSISVFADSLIHHHIHTSYIYDMGIILI